MTADESTRALVAEVEIALELLAQRLAEQTPEEG
jgi:hypothetical protein